MHIEIKEGIVTNDGAEIGAIHDGTCYLQKAVGPTVKGAIRKESGIVDLQFVVGEGVNEADSAGLTTAKLIAAKAILDDGESHVTLAPGEAVLPSLAGMSDDELAEEMKRRGLIRENEYGMDDLAQSFPARDVQPPVIERDLSSVERLHKLANEGRIPQPPAKHPAMGDKTPEYVAWFKSYATQDEIDIRYPDNRIVPATAGEFEKAEAKRHAALPGEKKDTDKSNDFTDPA